MSKVRRLKPFLLCWMWEGLKAVVGGTAAGTKRTCDSIRLNGENNQSVLDDTAGEDCVVLASASKCITSNMGFEGIRVPNKSLLGEGIWFYGHHLPPSPPLVIDASDSASAANRHVSTAKLLNEQVAVVTRRTLRCWYMRTHTHCFLSSYIAFFIVCRTVPTQPVESSALPLLFIHVRYWYSCNTDVTYVVQVHTELGYLIWCGCYPWVFSPFKLFETGFEFYICFIIKNHFGFLKG